MYNPDLIASAATLACLLEASAEKPGNVTPARGFHDMDYEDLLASAAAIGPAMGRAGEHGVGATILEAVQATRRATRANTNLGIVLLLAPLAAAGGKAQGARLKEQSPGGGEQESHQLHPAALRAELQTVLRSLTLRDAQSAYAAIRLAMPGGLDERVGRHDIRDEPRVTLREAMAEAAGRDSVAAEYLSDFAITFEMGLPALRSAQGLGLKMREAVVQAYLEVLAAVPDTLIARKRGRASAEAVSQGAAGALRAGGMFGDEGRRAVAAFDAGLREPGNSLNPGTTADLIAASLFVALLERD